MKQEDKKEEEEEKIKSVWPIDARSNVQLFNCKLNIRCVLTARKNTKYK